VDEQKIVSKILEESKRIQSTLNDVFLKEFGRMHGVDDNENFLELKQEVVAKRAYFLDVKKKYALWIVNREGVPVQEPDLKGLITRRSDYPSITKEGITELVNLLIKGEKVSFKKIRKYKDKKTIEIEDLIKMGDKRIARPVAFTKPLDEYKVIPSHVNGMLLWNNLVYEYFVPGTRGYQFKIKGIDPYKAPESVKNNLHYFNLKKNNNVVLPAEEEKLPDYFIINFEGSLKFAWEDRVNEFLDPVIHRVDNKRKIKLAVF